MCREIKINKNIIFFCLCDLYCLRSVEVKMYSMVSGYGCLFSTFFSLSLAELWSYFVAQACLKLVILLPQFCGCWDNWGVASN